MNKAVAEAFSPYEVNLVKKLGQGSFSTVWLAEYKSKKFAIKCLSRTVHPNKAALELRILRVLKGHHNVMSLHSSFRRGDRIFFIMRYFPNDPFPTVFRSLTKEEVKDYIRNLLIALRYIHSRGIVHRDVKPGNFLYNRRARRYALIDFGLAEVKPCSNELNENIVSHNEKANDFQLSGTSSSKMLDVTSPGDVVGDSITTAGMTANALKHHRLFSVGTKVKLDGAASSCECFGKARVCRLCESRRGVHANRAGTSGYRAPETLMLYEQQTAAVDIWAVGVVFLSLLSKRYPFMKADNEETALAQITTLFGSERVCVAAKRLGKKVICKPAFPALDLQKVCEALASTSCSSVDGASDTGGGPREAVCEACCNSVAAGDDFGQCLCLKIAEGATAVPRSPDPGYDLLYKLLTVDCFQRVSAEIALNHSYFVDHHS